MSWSYMLTLSSIPFETSTFLTKVTLITLNHKDVPRKIVLKING